MVVDPSGGDPSGPASPSARTAGQVGHAGAAPRAGQPADRPGSGPIPVAVDLGSARLRIWAASRGTASTATGQGPGHRSPVIRRGRVVDGPGCTALLGNLLRERPVPAGSVVVACRPVSATAADQRAVQQVLTAVLAPDRLLFIDTVRAAAIGAGAATGSLLIADVGAQLTEVAFLADGQVVAAGRAEIGTRDGSGDGAEDLLVATVVRLVNQLRRQPPGRRVAAAALARGLLVVGDGAARPRLIAGLAGALRTVVHPAAAPRTAALTGAGLAAMAAARHPGVG